MKSWLSLTAAALILGISVGPASAEPVQYTWHGYGTNVMGSSKCSGYEMNINVYVENGKVWGDWLQTGRVVRKFSLPLAADGSFNGQVDLQASIMNVKGNISADSARMDMNGYCVFGGILKKKQ
ncbi:MAG: hypothetical protein EXQ86_09865 [Rhodospirillales bacterium]|nr:hypothetical protein [Rhodospirillales bacterium]